MEIHANEFPLGGSSSNNYWISSGQGILGKYRTINTILCKSCEKAQILISITKEIIY